MFQLNKPVVFNFTGQKTNLSLKRGTYKFELWGAQGGSNSDGGLGGYASGIASFLNNVDIFLFIGGEGKFSTNPKGGFNGGADGRSGGGYPCGGGGGGTDIRFYESIASRFLIAGGGGGDGNYKFIYPGGCGGGIVGGDGTNWNFNSDRVNGVGGNQIEGGKSVSYGSSVSGGGKLFEGGKGTGSGYSGGGGGGGLFGGSGAYEVGGGGGSGYATGFISSTQLIRGDQLMPQISGPQRIGHLGNGSARITHISNAIFSCKPHYSFCKLSIIFQFIFINS